MSVDPLPHLESARRATRERVEAVFAQQPAHVAAAWLDVVMCEAVQAAMPIVGGAALAPDLWHLYEICENHAGTKFDVQEFLARQGVRPPKLTRRERLSRWWAARSEVFCAGMLAGMVLMGILHWWASSV